MTDSVRYDPLVGVCYEMAKNICDRLVGSKQYSQTDLERVQQFIYNCSTSGSLGLVLQEVAGQDLGVLRSPSASEQAFDEWRKPEAIQTRLTGYTMEIALEQQLTDIRRLLENAIGGGTIDLTPTPLGYPTQQASQNDLLLGIYAIANRQLKK